MSLLRIFVNVLAGIWRGIIETVVVVYRAITGETEPRFRTEAQIEAEQKRRKFIGTRYRLPDAFRKRHKPDYARDDDNGGW